MEKITLRKPVCNSLYLILLVIKTRDLEPGTRVNMHLKVSSDLAKKPVGCEG